ncbi:MAG: DUF86 domain-containing protein [Anaerolineales bacterium]|nr:DUF86 domain-containing protein [Anaerolineales bacterium]
MPVSRRDLSYIWDMRSAAQEILEFMQGVSLAEFERNNQLRYAVERQLMVIGEAARHVSDAFQEQHPEIPWLQIIGQRNVLAHDYGEILVERVWLTATKSLPELLIGLDQIIPNQE